MVQVFRVALPRQVPGIVTTDGEDTAVLVNSTFLGGDSAGMREVVNALLAACCEGMRPRYSATG